MLSRLWLVLALLATPADAAITLQGLGKPARVTVATTSSTVTVPAGTEYLLIRPITITGYIQLDCADGAALGTHYMTLSADTTVSLAVHHYGRSAICLAGSGAGTVEVWPMGRGL